MRVSLVAAALFTFLPLACTIASPAAAQTAKAAYSTSETNIGTLLDDPAARAVIDKHIPGFSKGDGISMARGMTLKAIQPFAADKITDEVLARIDVDLAVLAKK